MVVLNARSGTRFFPGRSHVKVPPPGAPYGTYQPQIPTLLHSPLRSGAAKSGPSAQAGPLSCLSDSAQQVSYVDISPEVRLRRPHHPRLRLVLRSSRLLRVARLATTKPGTFGPRLDRSAAPKLRECWHVSAHSVRPGRHKRPPSNAGCGLFSFNSGLSRSAGPQPHEQLLGLSLSTCQRQSRDMMFRKLECIAFA